MEYNTKRESFPDTIFAGMFGFDAAELLQATESAEERKAPQGLRLRTWRRDVLRAPGARAPQYARAGAAVCAGRARRGRREPIARVDLRLVGCGGRAGLAPARWRDPLPMALPAGRRRGRLRRSSCIVSTCDRGSSPTAARRSRSCSARAVSSRGRAIRCERRLLNVVEEMAIASGVAVPPVYMLDGEDGINAFAAGCSPNEAVIAVTRGALRDALARRAAGRDRRTSSATS